MSFSHPPQMRLLHVLFWASLVTLNTALGLQNSLSSHAPLRCCFLDEPPITMQNKRSYWNNGLDGIIKEHLLEHQSYLNWSCSSMRLFHHSNTTNFNDFVSIMHDCTNKTTGRIIDSPECLCDIGVAGWFQTSSRFGLVDFLPPFAHNRYVVFTHVSEATVSGKVWFFIQTFDGKAWASILGLFLMFSFLKILDKRFAVPSRFEPLPKTSPRFRRYLHYLTKSNIPFRLRKAIESTVMRMLMQSDESVVVYGNTTRQWSLNVILAVCALFLVLSYEASMTASLVQESIEARFQSVSDLLSCRVDPSDVCILSGGALETYWKNSIAIDECHIGKPPKYFNSYATLFEAVKDGRCKYAVVVDAAITSAIREKYCGDFVVVGKPLWSGGLSMLLPKGSPLTEAMSRATLDLLGNQTSTNLDLYMNKLPPCKMEGDTKLSFDKLRPFFIIAYSFGVVLFLAMVLVPQKCAEECGTKEACALRARVDKGRLSCTASSSSTEVSGNESTV